ncbi:MAG: hypothetical protein GX613_06490 [Chloroflexi bacterium]|nr:hypothetical protein [Chloroflexota bacterium]
MKHQHFFALAIAVFLLLAALALPMGRSSGTEGDPPGQPPEGADLPAAAIDLFTTSPVCTSCHQQMTDADGTDVSIDAWWGSTMMANAATDPYWQSSVRFETEINPHLKPVIEDKCATCHTPMAHFAALQGGEDTGLLDGGFFDPARDVHALAMDGVSCALCHQIEPDNLGSPDSFSGLYLIDADLPQNERRAYSRFEVDEAGRQVMQAASGYVPEVGHHISSAEMCATCHTLYTPYVDDAGEVAGTFPEQTPYLEWQQSSYGGAVPCQTCHMPAAQGPVVTSVTGGEPRSPFLTHEFVGGNAYMMRIFRAHSEELNVAASAEQFAATEQRALDQLQREAAALSIEQAGLSDTHLTAIVAVAPKTGHKFPTGFPSRRAWLHVTLTDAAGEVVFESGAWTEEGKVVGDDHDADPARYEPHHALIRSADEVQIYEAVLGDVNGEVTNVLLRAAGYLKDNRLLPAGFDKASAHEDTATSGAATDDGDFLGGSDRVIYAMPLNDAEGPFALEVELLYQTISYNWAHKLDAHTDMPEAARFLSYYEAQPNLPVVVASTRVEVSH